LQARAKEILRQRQAEQANNADTRANTAPAKPAVAPTPTPAPAAPVVTTPAPTTAVTPSTESQAELQARAQEVLRQQQGKPVTPTVPLTKAQKLAELNSLYKGDQITPAEYHKRRAAILAEP